MLAALAIVWMAARRLAGPIGALVAVLIVDGLHYLNYTSAKFNHDVIQLPFWALAGFAFHRALRGRQTTDWLLLGLAVGLSLWAKYFVAVLAVPMALFLFVDRDARKTLATPGPYIALAAALITMAPHLVWLVQNDFLPLAYAEHRAVLPRGWYDHLWHPLQFAISQLFFLVPSLLIALPLFYPRPASSEPPAEPKADAFDYRIVTWLAFGPIVTVVTMSALSGRGTEAMWGYPLWLFLGLWLVMTARRAFDPARLARIVITWGIAFTCLVLAFAANYGVLRRFDHRYRAVFFPGAAFGREIAQRYQAATGKPIAYVIGTMWDGGNLSHYAPSHPRVLVDGEPARAPWIDLADLKRQGAVVVWTVDYIEHRDPVVTPTVKDLHKLPAEFSTIAAGAEVQPPFTLPYQRLMGSVTVGWAILPAR